MKRLPKVATEMGLHVLAYNITRLMNIMGELVEGSTNEEFAPKHRQLHPESQEARREGAAFRPSAAQSPELAAH
jgi:hypothetical protein